ncbi:MAG TPA: 50S ribosomal protein L22 [Ignavibacteria bacterium]|nr:50S ribosomal protein L22 [Ignavibacteria bacterium]
MEARAIKRFVRSSPRKMRLIVDLIRNKNVEEAEGILKFSKKYSAGIVSSVLLSAYSNLVNKLDTGKVSKNEVIVKEAFVDGGPVLKRMLPAPQGRAFRIRKRTAHLTLIVENNEQETVAVTTTNNKTKNS